jgi:hypothetical protein
VTILHELLYSIFKKMHMGRMAYVNKNIHVFAPSDDVFKNIECY